MWIIVKTCLATLSVFFLIFFAYVFLRAIKDAIKVYRAVQEIGPYDIDRIVKKTGVNKEIVLMVIKDLKLG